MVFHRLTVHLSKTVWKLVSWFHHLISCHVSLLHRGGEMVDWRLWNFKKRVMYACCHAEKRELPLCEVFPGPAIPHSPLLRGVRWPLPPVSRTCSSFSRGCARVAEPRRGCVCSVCSFYSFLLCKGYLWIKHDWDGCSLCTLLPELYCSAFLF